MNGTFFKTIEYVLIGLIFLDIMVLVHEMGHFAAAKLFHVEIEYLQMGFGPELKRLGKRKKLSLAAIPFGGSCKMDNLSLYSVSPAKRALIYFAGPLANTVHSIFLFSLFFIINKYSLYNAVYFAIKQCYLEIKMFFEAIMLFVTGQANIKEILSGAFKASSNIGQLTAISFSSGFVAGINMILYLCASVNLSLGVANLLPIPALDGGFITVCLIETITHRTFSEKFYLIFQITGLIVLLVVLPIALNI